MKLQTPDAKGHDEVTSQPFWSELAGILHHLRRLQLVCCPDSGDHETESLLSRFFQDLKKTYESFSGGISFHLTFEIQQQQIATLAKAWLKGEEPQFEFNAEDIVHGEPHDWNDRIYAVTNFNKSGWVDNLRKIREESHAGITDMFTNVWGTGNRTFDYWYEIEREAYLRNMLKEGVIAEKQRMIMVFNLKVDPLFAILPSPAELTIATLREIFFLARA
jgi:hypothetical protein